MCVEALVVGIIFELGDGDGGSPVVSWEPSSSNDSAVAAPSGRQSLLLVDDLVALSRLSLVFDRHEVVNQARYVVAMKKHVMMAAERVLRRAKGSAALVWYSNDTTSMTSPKMYRNDVGDLVFMMKARQFDAADVCPGRPRPVRSFTLSLSGWRTRLQRRTLSATGGCSPTLGASRRAASCLGWSLPFVLRSVAQAIQGCLLNDLTHWHVSARCVFHLTLGVSQEGGFGVHGGQVSASQCKGGFRVITQQLCAAGWPDLLLDPNPAAFRRLAPTCGGRTVTLPRNSWTCS